MAASPELTGAREAKVGDITVRRLLPLRSRRTVGAWCFVDHYGPMSVDGVAGMRVPPHPHIGLQTVTWLLDGDVLHRDSLGTEQMIRPGQLNLMTAGHGIAHSEESPDGHDPGLHGVQLWLALPDRVRRMAPAFEHHADLPALGLDGFGVTVFAGALAGAQSPATTHSAIVGAEITARRHCTARIPLMPGHEHVIFVALGTATAQGAALTPGTLLYLGTGHESLSLAAAEGSTLFLLGGEPLGEPVLMWWNFVGRTSGDIASAAADWDRGIRFGKVAGGAEPLRAPPLAAATLKPRLSRPPSP